MRKTRAFQPTSLDGLESRIALSSLSAFGSTLDRAARHVEHAVKSDVHTEHRHHEESTIHFDHVIKK